jgi:diguanylate cyclase (GGDEF)-like protein/putative nucleotidyltransferase with HDIG domain
MAAELKWKIKRWFSSVEKKFNVNVNTKIIIPFFIVAVVIIGALSYFATVRISDGIADMEQRRALTVLENTVSNFEKEAKNLETYVRLLADSSELESAINSGNNNKIYEYLIPAKFYTQQQKIYLYDKDGRLLVEMANTSKRNPEEERTVIQALSGITSSELEVTQNGLEMYAVTPVHFDPIKNAEKIPAGVLLMDRHVSDQDFKKIKVREGVEITVFFRGKPVATTLDHREQKDLLTELERVIGRNETFYTLLTPNGIEYINTWQKLGSDGVISVMVPNDDLVAIKEELSGDILRVTVLAVILVLAASYVLAKVLLRPLTKILAITRNITNGDFSGKIDISTRDELGELAAAINFMADRIKERLAEAEHLATIDGLTGLYNHRYFQQRLEGEIERSGRMNMPLSLIIMDIDYFKHYNDIQGHPAGDKVLQQISRILRTSIRSIDIPVRYGGEEFAVILVNTAAAEAVEIAERIRQKVEEFPFAGRDEQPAGRLTISMGVASYPDNAIKKDELIKLADDALYKAKYISKNKVVLYYSVLDELKGELDKSENDLLNTIKTLISVINSKDKYTYGHSERVVHYAVSLAEAMGLSEEEMKIIRVSAYLHDIGKIEIDRDILNKSIPLTAEEQKILHQHPIWGAQIISSVQSLRDVIPVVLYHHEKFDGTGYPAGLAGPDIPLAARILKVVDSYDAMTTPRPYRNISTPQEAVEELIRCSGSDFDPAVVTMFINILDKIRLDDDKLVS